ncbi:hypothetical protein ACQEV2_23590 [Streptomyces sp. CA-251387]|uniref:hypothetical protein n=1 Tax=Streptomyces sp. CA-251387 TaxID=3240064 RepID=UPI003D91DC7C
MSESVSVGGGGGFKELGPERGGELAARWWQWALSAPDDRSPVRDRTGEFAGWRQPDDVWFLAGTYGGRVVRRCSMPSGRPVFFPVFNTQRAQTLTSREPMVMEVAEAKAFLNGAPLPMHEFTSKPFRAALRRRIAWGLWCAFDPLPVGHYVLEIKARTTGGFWVDTTYHLTVVDS